MKKIIQQNIELKNYNTFGFNVIAPYFAKFKTTSELKEIIKQCKEKKLEWYILAGGSNIIFTGKFNGVLIHPIANQITTQKEIVIADAGVDWDEFVQWSVDNGYCGLENLSYIPGNVGASPVQNIGAYGAQANDNIEWVEYLNTDTLQECRINAKDCEFGYRESIFKHKLKGKAVILRVAYRLKKEFKPNLDYGDLRTVVEKKEGGITPQNVRDAVIEIRKNKLPEPKELGNAGSFFKNPIVPNNTYEKILEKYPDTPHYTIDSEHKKIPAGWMIDKAGLKGHRKGNVGVHEKQALVLVNYGNGTAKEILELAEYIMKTVFEKFGVRIDMEVNIL